MVVRVAAFSTSCLAQAAEDNKEQFFGIIRLAWKKSGIFFIRMARNVPKVIFSITIVEEYKPSGRFIWEAVILSSQQSAILNTN